MGTYFGNQNSMSIGTGDTSAVATTGAGSASVAMPTTANGIRAKVVRIIATANARINFTNGAGTATSSSMLIGSVGEIWNVQSYTHFNHIQEGSAAKITVTPIEC